MIYTCRKIAGEYKGMAYNRQKELCEKYNIEIETKNGSNYYTKENFLKLMGVAGWQIKEVNGLRLWVKDEYTGKLINDE